MKMQPQILRLYGQDPDKIQASLDKAEREREAISGVSDEQFMLKYKAGWTQWVTRYKQVLST